jgi:phosphotransferase system enzyme I (PtsI)
VSASQGYAIGQVKRLEANDTSVKKRSIRGDRIAYEISRFRNAVKLTQKELQIVKNQVIQSIGIKEAQIFDAHVLILKDPFLNSEVEKMIEAEKVSCEYAFKKQIDEFIDIFSKQDLELTREKIHDLRDISLRLLSNLSETELGLDSVDLEMPAILVAHSLTPSVVSAFDQSLTLGFATDTGGATSHVSIIARSMQIPGVSGLSQISLIAEDEDIIILDGYSGLAILHPTIEDLSIYAERIEREKRRKYELLSLKELSPITLDGKHISLNANIELPLEAQSVIGNGAEGVGLFRSEFLYFQNELPTEEEQFQSYKQLLSKLSDKSVTIRTLDTGGDKLVKNLSLVNESNPFLGWRSIRVCLDLPDLFKEQLRALLRASVYGNLKIMFPMIASMEELLASKAIFKEVQAEMRAKGQAFDENIEVGMMVEVPAIVMLIDDFAKEVDFFSIGTNDLIQFTLAVDRSNEKIASLFNAHHPSILKMIHLTCKAAHEHGISVSVCGEMASDPLSVLLLAGLGVDELSMSPWSIMETKELVRSLNFSDLRNSALACLKLTSAHQIDAYLYKKYGPLVMDINANSPIHLSEDEEIVYKGYEIKFPRSKP